MIVTSMRQYDQLHGESRTTLQVAMRVTIMTTTIG